MPLIALQASLHVCAVPSATGGETPAAGSEGMGPLLIGLVVPGVGRELSGVSAIDSALPEHVSFSIFTYYETFRHYQIIIMDKQMIISKAKKANSY